MQPLAPLLINDYVAELQREAAAHRRAKAAAQATRRARGQATRFRARWLGNGLMFVATRLDPSLGRPSYGRE